MVEVDLGNLTVAYSFRAGCIGRIAEPEMRGALDAMRAVLKEMDLTDCRPHGAALPRSA